jgi:hypothetical protein
MGMGRRGNATTGTTGVHHQQRQVGMGDKVSGMMMKLKGSVTNKPGLKVCFGQLQYASWLCANKN